MNIARLDKEQLLLMTKFTCKNYIAYIWGVANLERGDYKQL